MRISDLSHERAPEPEGRARRRSSKKERRVASDDFGRSPILMIFGISAAIAGILAVSAWWMHHRLNASTSRPPMSPEVQAYLRQIAVQDARMSAADTPLGTAVTYLDARLVNQGSRTLRELDLRMEFVDMAGQMILRQTARPVTPNTAPLKPGETRNLHVTFDHMPPEWNQAPPAFTPIYASF